MNLFQVDAPLFELSKVYLAWFAGTLFVLLPLQIHSTQKKSKALRLNGSITFFPKKCWNCEWSWAVALSFIFPLSLMQAGQAKSLALKDTHLAAIEQTDQIY